MSFLITVCHINYISLHQNVLYIKLAHTDISYRIEKTRDCSAFEDAVPCTFFYDCCVECPKQRAVSVALLVGSLLLLLLLLAIVIGLRARYQEEFQRSVTLMCMVAFYFQRADLFKALDLRWPEEYVDTVERTASLTSFDIFGWAVEPNCVLMKHGQNGTYLDLANESMSIIGQASLPFIMIVWIIFTQVPQLLFCFSWAEFGDKAMDVLGTILSLFFMPYFKSWALVRTLLDTLGGQCSAPRRHTSF